MDKVLEIIIDVILAILVMFAAVTVYFGLKTETSVKSIVINIADDYIADIKKKGYFTLDDYETFYHKLSMTNAVYDVNFEHSYTIWEPEYRMKTLQEILEAQNAAYSGKNVYTYKEVKTEVPTVTDLVNTGNLNTETNESVLKKAVNTPASSSHVHTDDCYADHVHNSNCGKIIVQIINGYMLFKCADCGAILAVYWGYSGEQGAVYRCYYHYVFMYGNGSAYNKENNAVTNPTESSFFNDNELFNKISDVYLKYGVVWSKVTDMINAAGTTTDIDYKYENGHVVGVNNVVVTSNPFYPTNLKIPFYSGTGGYAYDYKDGIIVSGPYLNNNWTEDYRSIPNTCYNCGCSICNGKTDLGCNQAVIAISATNPNQTVYTGNEIITTATAAYLDGSTKTIVCSASGYDKNKLGEQDVTLTYTGIVDNATKTGTKKCNIKITVIPRTNNCRNYHTYNLNSDGSDPGCPYCRAWVKSLQFINPASTDMVITIGTTLQDNGVRLLATYMDEHKENITDQYADNLDISYLGTMTVTVGYKGATAQLRVTTVCKKSTCSICGNTYNLYPDGSDPGCPYCIAKIPVFTGNIRTYDEILYTEDILKSLSNNGRYEFYKNDRFTIYIRNKTSNVARKILSKIYPSISYQWIELKKSTIICSN